MIVLVYSHVPTTALNGRSLVTVIVVVHGNNNDVGPIAEVVLGALTARSLRQISACGLSSQLLYSPGISGCSKEDATKTPTV